MTRLALERSGAPSAEKVALLEQERARLVRDIERLRANLASIDRKLARYRVRGR